MAKSANNYDVRVVEYTKESGEKTKRDIIVFADPRPHYMAIEVTNVAQHEVAELQLFLRKQKQDLADRLARAGAEWKQFKPEGLTFIDNKDPKDV